MTTPKEALERALSFVETESGEGSESEVAVMIRSAIASLEGDAVESVAQAVTTELEKMYKDGVPMCMREAATALTEARAEIERLRAEVYVPGQWRCAKCKFTLQQMNLNANTGTVTARDNAGDKCPNCNSPLWRATWKQDAHEMLDRATEQMERVKVAESELSTLRARVREVVGGMLVHSCVADAGQDCKDEEDEAAERAARQLNEDLK